MLVVRRELCFGETLKSVLFRNKNRKVQIWGVVKEASWTPLVCLPCHSVPWKSIIIPAFSYYSIKCLNFYSCVLCLFPGFSLVRDRMTPHWIFSLSFFLILRMVLWENPSRSALSELLRPAHLTESSFVTIHVLNSNFSWSSWPASLNTKNSCHMFGWWIFVLMGLFVLIGTDVANLFNC